MKPSDSTGADGRQSPPQRANSLGRWSDGLSLLYVWKKLEGQLSCGLSSQDSRSLGAGQATSLLGGREPWKGAWGLGEALMLGVRRVLGLLICKHPRKGVSVPGIVTLS